MASVRLCAQALSPLPCPLNCPGPQSTTTSDTNLATSHHLGPCLLQGRIIRPSEISCPWVTHSRASKTTRELAPSSSESCPCMAFSPCNCIHHDFTDVRPKYFLSVSCPPRRPPPCPELLQLAPYHKNQEHSSQLTSFFFFVLVPSRSCPRQSPPSSSNPRSPSPKT